MAISQEVWDKAKTLFELGYSLTEIEDDTGIKRTSVSKKAKSQNWVKGKNQQLESDIIEYESEKSTLEAKKSTLVEKVAQLSDFEITILDEKIQEKTKLSSLITSTASLALIRTNQLLTKNKKQVAIKVTEYANGKPSGQGVEFVEMDMDMNDYKLASDTIDKLSITTNVNDRHSKSQVEINNANLQQNNNIENEIIITRKGC